MPFEKPEFQPRIIPKEEFFAKAEALTEEDLRELGLGKKEPKESKEVASPVLRASWKNPENQNEREIEIDIQKDIQIFDKIH